mmetsp:Transcript_17118/g.65313  ORF Transcript_17118/g.65313 Transcript_17118/m.65313 type:complete len:330 (+) Transcript_17118:1555-2544(+)
MLLSRTETYERSSKLDSWPSICRCIAFLSLSGSLQGARHEHLAEAETGEILYLRAVCVDLVRDEQILQSGHVRHHVLVALVHRPVLPLVSPCSRELLLLPVQVPSISVEENLLLKQILDPVGHVVQVLLQIRLRAQVKQVKAGVADARLAEAEEVGLGQAAVVDAQRQLLVHLLRRHEGERLAAAVEVHQLHEAVRQAQRLDHQVAPQRLHRIEDDADGLGDAGLEVVLDALEAQEVEGVQAHGLVPADRVVVHIHLAQVTQHALLVLLGLAFTERLVVVKALSRAHVRNAEGVGHLQKPTLGIVQTQERAVHLRRQRLGAVLADLQQG